MIPSIMYAAVELFLAESWPLAKLINGLGPSSEGSFDVGLKEFKETCHYIFIHSGHSGHSPEWHVIENP